MTKNTRDSGISTCPPDRLARPRTRISWPLLVVTLGGVGLIGVAIILWLRGFDVLGRAPLLVVVVALWAITEALVWADDDWT